MRRLRLTDCGTHTKRLLAAAMRRQRRQTADRRRMATDILGFLRRELRSVLGGGPEADERALLGMSRTELTWLHDRLRRAVDRD